MAAIAEILNLSLFHEIRCDLIPISQKYVPNDRIDKKAAFVKIMA